MGSVGHAPTTQPGLTTNLALNESLATLPAFNYALTDSTATTENHQINIHRRIYYKCEEQFVGVINAVGKREREISSVSSNDQYSGKCWLKR